MEKSSNFELSQPRVLRYRSHYRIYLVALLVIGGFNLSFWGFRLTVNSWPWVYAHYTVELWCSLAYFIVGACLYFFWLKYRLEHTVQVFSQHISILHHGKVNEIRFVEVESVEIVGWSVFYLKMKSGIKHYFSSSLERADYVWEGLHEARPDLFTPKVYETFRMKLVQYDHQQKRKEWFFRHKLVDIFNWVLLPLAFLCVSYLIQTREIMIHQQGLYFFRLFMYSILVILFTTFVFSFVVNKFIFDKRIQDQMGNQPNDKIRDLEFEGVVLQRSKLIQMVTAVFVFSLVMRSELNLYSLTRLKEDVASFNLKQGKMLLVDNRYNCIACKYSVKDGDLILFGRGTFGQIMATEGDMVGQIAQDRTGRIIASENVQEVPKGHVAVKLAHQNDVVMVKIEELIGKIQK